MMKRTSIFFLLLMSGALSASILSLPAEKYQLDNGLTVILREDHRLPKVAVNMWYHVGAGNETKGRSGFAHLFEHLMFQGSKHVGADKHFAILESIGAEDVNGTTNLARTNYYETVPKAYLETALWLESDRMGFLKSMVTQAVLDEQRDVVKNERRQRVEYAPYQETDMAWWNAVFPAGHPYYGNVIGSMADLDAATLNDVNAFFDTFYTPANATLTLVGDFDSSQAKKWIEKYFASLRGAKKPKRPVMGQPTHDKGLMIQETENMGQFERQKKCWFTPAFFKKGDADFDIWSRILTGREEVGLSHELVKEKGLALQVSAYQRSMSDFSLFCFDVILKTPGAGQKVWAIVDTYIEAAGSSKTDENAISIAQAGFRVDRLFSLERIGGSYGVADMMQMYDHYVGQPNYFAEDIGRYENVTPETIASVVQTYILKSPSMMLIATPKSAESTPAPAPNKGGSNEL